MKTATAMMASAIPWQTLNTLYQISCSRETPIKMRGKREWIVVGVLRGVRMKSCPFRTVEQLKTVNKFHACVPFDLKRVCSISRCFIIWKWAHGLKNRISFGRAGLYHSFDLTNGLPFQNFLYLFFKCQSSSDKFTIIYFLLDITFDKISEAHQMNRFLITYA